MSQRRIILVTGSTDGIGKYAALVLAQRGAHVIIHGRSQEKGEATREEIRRQSGSSHVDLLTADLSSQREVRDLADQVLSRYDRLDVLINNAALFMKQRRLTEDGIETTFAVNHLAPFLLTNLLLDRLITSTPARIVNVSSGAHAGIGVDFSNLQGEQNYDGYQAYGLSKLGNILFTYALAERLKETRVTANAMHPGVISTNLLRAGWGGGGAPVSQGAETLIYLALSEEVQGVTGEYFRNKQPLRSAVITYDRQIQESFWQLSAEFTGLP